MVLRASILLLLITSALPAQPRRIDPRFTHTRLIAVVPLVGTGAETDPRRPKYAPLPGTKNSPIIAFTFQSSDDGAVALTEFVARDMSAFKDILADKSIKVFIKGKDKMGDIESELKRYKKDFSSLDKFGVILP